MKIPKEQVEAAQKNGISYSALRKRLMLGMDPEEAISRPIAPKKKTILGQFLESEFSVEERRIAKENGISDEELRRRVLEGWNSEDIITVPEEPTEAKETKLVIGLREITQFANQIGLSYGQVESYLNMGKTFEEIKKLYDSIISLAILMSRN